MRRPILALALAAIALAPVPAFAQAKKPTPSKAQVQRAAFNLRVFVSALQSDKLPETMRDALFGCVYSAPFREISEGTDKLITEKKLSLTDPNVVVQAMAAICGFRPTGPATPPKK